MQVQIINGVLLGNSSNYRHLPEVGILLYLNKNNFLTFANVRFHAYLKSRVDSHMKGERMLVVLLRV